MIRVENLNKTYDRHRRSANHVLKDVSFELPQTGFVCILGPSGCGKTSLLNAIGGLDKFDDGTIATDSVSVSRYGTKRYEAERNRNFGYIFQNYYLLPEHSVAYNIYLGLHSLKLSHAEKLKRIRQALAAVDMSRYIRRKVGDLSGGQQQRVAIARALARRPRVIFADEPTGNLDEANTMNICTLLRQISKESLVVMVTHEERIANFFADRIIKLDNGVISEDAEGWQRDGMSLGSEKEIYAGDYAENRFEADSVSLRVLQEAGAAPVEVTVVALKDRILIKLADNRAVSCGAPGEVPVLKEGPRPVLTLETVDQSEQVHGELTGGTPAPQARAGHGIRLGMMLQEAAQLAKGGGAKRVSMRLFLILLTILTLWTACDYLTVSSVDPRDFITTESHILEIKMKRGSGADASTVAMDATYRQFGSFLAESGLDFDFMPAPISSATFSDRLFPQMGSVSAYLRNFNYVLIDRLDPGDIIYGRMPESSGEIVVDKWILEKLIEDDSIISNAVSNVGYFLNQDLYLDRNNLYLTIVGISDCTEPALYLSRADLLRSVSVGWTMMGLSEFRANHPGEYDDVTLGKKECLVNTYVAGSSYADYIGHEISGKNGFSWTIADTIQTSDMVMVVVNDGDMDTYLQYLCTSRFYIYCADKEAMKNYIANQIPEELADALIVDVVDSYSDSYGEYMEASRLKVNARTVVTMTVIALSMVMLYLLCRAQAQERIGMLAVYRLLGIPKGKLAAIFAMEAALSSVRTALPSAAAVWLVITILNGVEDLNLKLILPWQAAAAVYGCILLYHLIVALLPLRKLLHMPPAQLAAKYDF